MRNRARKIWLVLLSLGLGAAAVTVAPTAAFADPSPAAGNTPSGSVVLYGGGVAKVHVGKAVSRPAEGAVSTLQVPPLGGCDYWSQLHVSWKAYYTNGAITNAVVTFGAGITCTPTASGQSMAALSTQATLWFNGSNINSTPAKGCGTCNAIATGDKTLSCVAAACVGSYWGSGDQLMMLPAGYIWSEWNSDCKAPLPQTPDVLECLPITTVTSIPATH